MTTSAQALEGRVRELLEAPNFAFAATIGANGAPHVIPIWQHPGADGTIELNSAEGRVWPRNVERDGRIAINVPDSDNPYEYVEIRGQVEQITREGADEHIDMLAKKYMDADTYPFRKEGEVRLLIRVRPERVRHYGGG